MKSRRRRIAIAIVVLLVLTRPISISGTTEYDALIDKGVEELNRAVEQGKTAKTHAELEAVILQFQQAANTFREAQQKDPVNGLAWLRRGQTFNRMGEAIKTFNKGQKTANKVKGGPAAFCNAHEEISRAQTLRLSADNRRTSVVELAFALLRIGKLQAAKKMAGEFLSTEVGDSILRQTAAAVQCEAQQQIEEKERQKKRIRICGDAPNPFAVPGQPPPPDCGSSPKAVAVPQIPSSPTPENTPQAQYTKSITSGFGYNGNAIPLGNGVQFPPGVSHKDAAFQEATLNLEADWFFYHNGGTEGLVDKLAATYIGVYDRYDDLSIADTLLQTGGLSYCHCLDEKTCIGLQIKDAWLRSDTKNISNTLSLQPNVSYAESPELTTKFSYSAIGYDYSMTPKQPLAIQDGFGHQLAIEQTWAHSISDGVWSPDVTITAKYLHQWFVTEGIVGDKQRDDPFIKADWCIFKADNKCATLRSVNLAASYEYRRDEYENVTFPALKNGTKFKRRDDTHLIDVALILKLLYDEEVKNRLEAVLEYQSNTNDSNIATKEYDQPRFIASLKVNF